MHDAHERMESYHLIVGFSSLEYEAYAADVDGKNNSRDAEYEVDIEYITVMHRNLKSSQTRYYALAQMPDGSPTLYNISARLCRFGSAVTAYSGAVVLVLPSLLYSRRR